MCSRVVFSFCWLERESLPCAQELSFLSVGLKRNLLHVLKSFSCCWLERESLPGAQELSFLSVGLKGNLFHVLKSCLFLLLA